jgi:hypothetical protein
LTNGNRECLYHVIPKLWLVGEVSPKWTKIPTQSKCGNGAT